MKKDAQWLGTTDHMLSFHSFFVFVQPEFFYQ